MNHDMSDQIPGQMSISSLVYNDEDNAPMNEWRDDWDKDGHNPTVYLSRAEMKAAEKEPIPFDDPPRDGCWNCLNYNWDHEACTTNWNNMDEDYYCPDTDDRDPTDYCDNHELDEDAVWEDVFGDD